MNRRNYSKTKMELHPKEGMKLEMYASPFIRICIGIAVLLVASGLLALMLTPLVYALKQAV